MLSSVLGQVKAGRGRGGEGSTNVSIYGNNYGLPSSYKATPAMVLSREKEQRDGTRAEGVPYVPCQSGSKAEGLHR